MGDGAGALCLAGMLTLLQMPQRAVAGMSCSKKRSLTVQSVNAPGCTQPWEERQAPALLSAVGVTFDVTRGLAAFSDQLRMTSHIGT